MKNFLTIILVWLVVGTVAAQSPKIEKHNSAWIMTVDGKPFVMRAGEISNSGGSTKENLEKNVWPQLKENKMNTALIPAYWHLIEPEDGKFDFTSIDDVIEGAEKNNIKVVFLWFGAWKNSMSCYVPSYIKRDTKRFPRAISKDGIQQEILSPFSVANLNQDKRAFVELLKHIKTVDKNNTVIMIQVENEIAMLPSVRDYSKAADLAWNANVPSMFTKYLEANKKSLSGNVKKLWTEKNSGTWQQLFVNDIYAEEIFQAWAYAVYTNEIAKAGKAVYNIPMYVNCALNRPNKLPGEYPSAGPLPHLIDVWKAGAPNIDMLSPDIYFGDFKSWTKPYHRSDNPYFIPEHEYDKTAPAKALYAFGEYHTMGFSPFSAENNQSNDRKLIAKAYTLVETVEDYIIKYTGTENMRGILLDSISQRDTIMLGGYKIMAKHDNLLGWTPQSKQPNWNTEGAVVISLGNEEFLVFGTGVCLTFDCNDKKQRAGIDWIQLLSPDDKNLRTILWLNGDEDHQGRHVRIPDGEWQIQKFKLYKY